ncbi:phosphonate ABC transporter, permease protein PhnE [Mesorhizobium amorphae]|nr:phosphonate ABC transporter, permease protein PhnE [Mesorhizobium amorphae]
MDLFRSIHELVYAVLFVVAVGLGPFAGVMALFIHTTGILAKLFSEAVEAIDPRPVEAIRATGATRLQEVVFGVVPQVLPLWMSYALYRFESNVRAATVLGVIGAGGIGQVLFESIRGFYYPEAAAMLIIMLVTVSLIDVISQQLRKLFL